jgi:hypothetical protein
MCCIYLVVCCPRERCWRLGRVDSRTAWCIIHLSQGAVLPKEATQVVIKVGTSKGMTPLPEMAMYCGVGNITGYRQIDWRPLSPRFIYPISLPVSCEGFESFASCKQRVARCYLILEVTVSKFVPRLLPFSSQSFVFPPPAYKAKDYTRLQFYLLFCMGMKLGLPN